MRFFRSHWPFNLVLALVVMFGLFPLFMGPFKLHILIFTVWMVFLCAAWNISVLPGLFSLMSPIAIGCGSHVSTMLWLYFGISPWLGMLAGALAASIIAYAVGWCSFRFRLPPLSFAIFTIILCIIFQFFVMAVPIKGSTEGTYIFYRGTNPLLFQFESKVPFYYIVFIFALGVIYLNHHIMRSGIGDFFRAIRDNERFAAACGINVTRYKIVALVISCAITAIGGTFWAQYGRFVSPYDFSIHMGVYIILLSVIGGAGTLWGPPLGAVILVPVGEVLKAKFSTSVAGLNHIVYGVIVVIILLTLRKGIMTWLTERLQKRKTQLASVK